VYGKHSIKRGNTFKCPIANSYICNHLRQGQFIRKLWRYQRDNQKPYFVERQTVQRLK